MSVRPSSKTKRAVMVAALCPLVLASCSYPGLNTPPPSASLADPWGELSTFRAGDKLRVYLDEGVVGGSFLQLAGRFVSAIDVSITIAMNVDQFSRPPQTGAGSLFLLEPELSYWSDPARTSSRRRREIEFAVEGVAVRGDEVEMTLRKQAVLAVSRPNAWRWAGPLRDCGYVSLPGAGIGALSGWAAGDTGKGTWIGAALGCGLGVLFWYADRSDTAALEWDTVYRRLGSYEPEPDPLPRCGPATAFTA